MFALANNIVISFIISFIFALSKLIALASFMKYKNLMLESLNLAI